MKQQRCPFCREHEPVIVGVTMVSENGMLVWRCMKNFDYNKTHQGIEVPS